jgi:hypothetical protein
VTSNLSRVYLGSFSKVRTSLAVSCGPRVGKHGSGMFANLLFNIQDEMSDTVCP